MAATKDMQLFLAHNQHGKMSSGIFHLKTVKPGQNQPHVYFSSSYVVALKDRKGEEQNTEKFPRHRA